MNGISISSGSIKRCKDRFRYIVGIGKVINTAVDIIGKLNIQAVIGEFLDDPDDIDLYNVLLFLLKENTDIEELNNYKEIDYDKKRRNATSSSKIS